ncbi:MAG: dihydroorotate dehydrogenase [Coriobacteriales bacterium]|nr:dihydroorotate dehydrogenase [Coriobacteriales bacterium]
MSVELSVNLGGLVMKNPVTVASGTFGSGREYAELWSASPSCPGPLNALGAITTKGVSFEPWAGNPGIRITETASGMLNSIGLQNGGVEYFCSNDLVWLASQNVPVIVNVSGHSGEEYTKVIQRLEREEAVAAYEVNISCPNVASGGMSFGTDAAAAAEVTKLCRQATKRPLLVKLTPNVTDITEIARAVEAAGADAISLINTVAGMAIDAQKRTKVFDRGVAGLSGPAVKPVALYAVYRVYQAVDIPLLGIGGIRSACDAVEFFLAGATAVAVGTANFSDPLRALRLAEELSAWCASEGIQDIKELRGALKDG